MTNQLRRIGAVFLSVAMVLSLCPWALGDTPTYPADRRSGVEGDYTGKTVILHSNDVHGEIMGYAYMAALRDTFQNLGADVILADAGDFSQGTPNVSLSKGANAVAMMNAAGYNVATLGNHEFDFGYEQLKSNLAEAKFPVICADVYENGSSILDPTWIYEGASGLHIGFFGMETPETQTKVNPGLIQGIQFTANTSAAPKALYECAQEQIDTLRSDGADIVIGLVHLGVDAESAPDGHRSVDLYKNTQGIDILLDGHSHTVMTAGENGEPIQSTGTKFANIGVVVIDNESEAIEDHYLIPTDNLPKDADVETQAQAIIDRVNDEYGQVFATSEIYLNGERAPGNRTEETNLGDLITDAMVWKVLKENQDEDGNVTLTVSGVTVDEDHVVGITNGGGIRASIQPGEITRKNLNEVLPFGNTVAVVFVTGEELLEALEASTYATPEALGGYPQTHGIQFTLDTTKAYDKGELYPESTYYSPASIQRVTIDSINWEDFDPDETYAVVTNNFCAAGGDTYYAFKAASAQFDTGIVMDEAVMEYVAEALGGTIAEDGYGEPRHHQTILPDFYYPDEAGRTLGALFAEAVDKGETTIALREDAVLSETASVPEDASVMLNLNGHTLTVVDSAGLEVRGGYLTVTGGGQFVTDGGTEALITQYSGNVTIRDAALLASDASCVRVLGQGDPNSYTGLYLEEGAELTSNFRNTQPDAAGVTAAVAAQGSSYVEMTDSTIRAVDCGNGMAGIRAEDAVLNLASGSVVEADGSAPTAVIFTGREHATFSIREGAVLRAGSETASQACALLVSGNGGSVDGATVEATAQGDATAVQVDSGWMFLDEGTDEQENPVELRVTARSKTGTADAVRVYAPEKSKEGEAESEEALVSVFIGGGVFNGNVYAHRDGQQVEDDEILTIMGGLYSVRPADGYFPEGFLIAEELEDGFYRVTDDGKFYTATCYDAYGYVSHPYAREGEEITFTVYDYEPKTFDCWEGLDGLEVLKQEDGKDSGYTTHSITFLMPARDVEITAVYVDEGIKILYTNDIHTYIDNTRKNDDGETISALRYSTVAGYRQAIGADFLVDAGDHIQGTSYGTYDKGHTIVNLMNAAGYTAATLGNHEFDYDMTGTRNVIDWANYDYVSCNILNSDGTQLLPSYKVYEAENGKKVAFVGITTPETITKSTPAYFMNEDGEIVWNFSEGDEGAKLYAVVQNAIDAAAQEADYVIGVGHMGVDEGSAPYTSEDVIHNTTGFTAFIDGHSHTQMAMKTVADKNGSEIVLTQTKCYLEYVGEMTIDSAGNVTTELHDAADLADVTPDAQVKAIEDEIIGILAEEQQKVIAHTDVALNINAGANNDGERLVRKQETTIGNFCADATYHYFDSRGYNIDAAFMNGGGIRAPLSGDITVKNLKDIYPWGNVLCLVNMTGQQILDGLEFGAKNVNSAGTGESGGFLHVSGIKYEINAAIPSTTQSDDNGIWTGGPTGEYRVSNVQVKNRETGKYEPLELDKHYAVGGINYTLRNLGDGFAMFTGENIVDGVAVDYMALQEYVQSFPADSATGLPTLKAGMGYDAPEGRIVIKTAAEPGGTGSDGVTYKDGTYTGTLSSGGKEITAKVEIQDGKIVSIASPSDSTPQTVNLDASNVDETVLASIAQAKGISVDDLKQALQDALNQAVDSGGTDNNNDNNTGGGGCYVATSVYGSYDCPEVWTLRRFRDDVLGQSWYGRLFIKAYYTVSPTIVRLFGNTDWFQSFWRAWLDNMEEDLQDAGFQPTPYNDPSWT